MANRTIYPYGAGGQTPSGIGIVDDLVTGGSNYALSAEMGKELNERILNNVSVERGTCVKFGTKVYTKLNSRQIELLNSTSVMSMTFMMNGGNGGYGSEDWRYIEIGAYSTDPNVLSFATTFWGGFYKRGFTVNDIQYTVTAPLSRNVPHPVVCTLVCDREHGTVKFYKGTTLVNTDTRNEYKVSKFVGDDGVIVFDGGDNNCRFYGLQFHDFDIIRGGYLNEILNNAEISTVDVNMKTSYAQSHTFTDHTNIYQSSNYNITTSNGERTITKKDGAAGTFYLTGFSTQYDEFVVQFTIDKKFKYGGWYINGRLLYDNNGTLVYDGQSSDEVFEAGTYKMVAFWPRYSLGITTTEDGATLIIHSSQIRNVGCIANFKFDTLYNRKVYDDVADKFYTFYSDSSCTTVTDNYSISSLPLKSIHIGDLTFPHYIGEIKMVGENIYIANGSWTWKKINNT